jgi:hypothetical protein
MPDSALLTDAEIRELTRRKKRKSQAEVLRKMGIRHAVRPDGTILVARALVTKLLGLYDETPAPSSPGGQRPHLYDGVLNVQGLRARRPQGRNSRK